MTTITLQVEVPRRVESWADAQDASDAVVAALNRYLMTHSQTGGEIHHHAVQPNAQLVAIMPQNSTRLILDAEMEELKKYLPQQEWDRHIPMRVLLNAFRHMPTAAREAVHAEMCGLDYDPGGPKFEGER